MQEQAAAAQTPEPSIRVALSAEADALIRSGRAQAEAQAGALAVAASGVAPSVGAVTGGLQTLAVPAVGAATGGLSAPAPENAQSPQAMATYLATGQKPGPDEPSGPQQATPTDWTEKPKVEEEKPPEPPREPISKKLLEFLQTLWRAGGNAIDVAQNGNQVLNPNKEADGPITYSDPSAKKTTGL